jgi:hypothetical protein
MLCLRNVSASILVLLLGLPAVAGEPISNFLRADVPSTDRPKPQKPDTDLLALMTGTCSTLKVAGRDFACRAVAYAHSTGGRAYFTIALDDVNDRNHVISFSGENGLRTTDNLYDLTIDRMLLNSSDRPKVDGLPVAATVTSEGRCVQLGNFATGRVSSIVCSATDTNGKQYQFRFESDGSPITVRRVNPSAPTIRQNG